MLLLAAIIGIFFLPEPWNIVALIAAAIIEVAEVYGWIWFLRRYRVQTGSEGLLGERAVVIEVSPDRPDRGRVRVHGELWNARFEQVPSPGDELAVRAVDGLTVVCGRR